MCETLFSIGSPGFPGQRGQPGFPGRRGSDGFPGQTGTPGVPGNKGMINHKKCSYLSPRKMF